MESHWLFMVIVGAVAVAASFLIGFYLKVEAAKKTLAGKPEVRHLDNNPLTVQLARDAASAETCKERHLALECRLSHIERRLDWGEKRFARIERGFAESVTRLIAAGAEREQRLSDRIGDVVKGLADLSGYIRGKLEQEERTTHER